MIRFPNIDPVAFSLGPVNVHWYGIAYLVGIGLGWIYLRNYRTRLATDWDREQVGDVVFYAAMGGVLGGRIGYMAFYNFEQVVNNPLSLFAVWQGGMSFHGGVLGFIAAIAVFGSLTKRRFFNVTDFVVPAVPIGLFFGRLANFVNQELWGAPTTLPWGVLFTHPHAGNIARHPSQLYEAFLEGVVLFLILHLLSRGKFGTGFLSGVFLLTYGIFRSLVETVREPDQHIGYLAGDWLTMGQVLSLPMILLGAAILLWCRGKGNGAQAIKTKVS